MQVIGRHKLSRLADEMFESGYKESPLKALADIGPDLHDLFEQSN